MNHFEILRFLVQTAANIISSDDSLTEIIGIPYLSDDLEISQSLQDKFKIEELTPEYGWTIFEYTRRHAIMNYFKHICLIQILRNTWFLKRRNMLLLINTLKDLG